MGKKTEVIEETVNFGAKHPKIARGIAIIAGAIVTGGIVAVIYFGVKGIKSRKAKNTSETNTYDEFDED